MILFLLYFVLGAILCLIIGLILYARWNYGTLEALKIPVVERTFMLGSTPDLHLKVQHFEDIARVRKYGYIYGVYEGRTPQVHICDPEVVKLVLVKDADHFYNRRGIDLGDPIMNQLPDFLHGGKWKIIRGAQTPFFTSAKMKNMRFTFQASVDEFLTTLQQDCHKTGEAKVNIASKFDGCVIDIFCRIGFGVKMGDSFDPNNTFVKLFKDLMGQNQDFGLLYTLSMVFPFLTKFAPTLNSEPSLKIASTLREIMDARRASQQKNNDFVDVLNEMMSKLQTDEYKNSDVTETTVLAQGIGLVLAGYDAMTTTLSMLAYYLCKNPEIQDKLFEEIDNFVEEHNGEIPFEKMNEMPYLHACFTEVYRLCPPFIRPERICNKDWEHNGLKIKKGTVIMTPAWSVNRHPDIYDDPEAFYPERFMTEDKSQLDQYAFLTFGHGPRNCIGKKFAYEVSKVVLCNILREFRLEALEETKITYKPGVLFLVMYDPIYINIIKRSTK